MVLKETTTVLIVDDDEDIRFTLKTILDTEGFRVVGEAGDGAQAIALATKLQPNVIVLDYLMPGMNGELAAGVIRTVAPKSRILAFSAIVEKQPTWSDAYLNKKDITRIVESLEALS
ncbi:MAG: response regulator transcription factor [Actinomycetota bacterium]|nr:response regulator transcription factor [Actinomycetota bacterium]